MSIEPSNDHVVTQPIENETVREVLDVQAEIEPISEEASIAPISDQSAIEPLSEQAAIEPPIDEPAREEEQVESNDMPSIVFPNLVIPPPTDSRMEVVVPVEPAESPERMDIEPD